MKRRLILISAFVALVLTAFSPAPALSIEEPERLWLVGERAFADGLYPVARRALERFVERYPRDERTGNALLMLGKARLTLGELDAALDAFRRAAAFTPPPGQGLETKFWQAETHLRLKQYPEARALYDEVLRNDMSSPFAPDALYGYGWAELETKRPEPAVTAFQEFLQAWGDHPLAPPATFQLGRGLIELKRYKDALAALENFATKYQGHKLVPDAQYLHAWTRVQSGDIKGGHAELRAFVEAAPTHPLVPEARKLLRELLAKTGDKAQLQEVYASLMSQSPATPEALGEALAIAQRLGRPRDVDAAWRRLRADFPEHPATQKIAFDLANAAFKRKDWKDAVAYATVATASADDTIRAEAWLLTGESDLKLRRFAAAAKAFEEVGAVPGADPGVRFRALAGLGLAREEQKDWRAALSAYEAVAAKSPDTALRQWARERAAVVKTRIGGKPPQPSAKPRG